MREPEQPGRRILRGPAPERGWRLSEHSLSKLWIKFGDQAAQERGITLHSRDWAWKRSKVRNQELGIRRFQRYILRRARDIRFARIYDAESNIIIKEYRNGNWV